MQELEHLRSMWSSKVKRTTMLIVPAVSYVGGIGSLNNDFWSFNVSYAFRDALDIKHEQRKKGKKPYMVWTQGPLISLKDGDVLYSQCGKKAVQVRFANQMGWDSAKSEMHAGNVVYIEFSVGGNNVTELTERNCTQMQFLKLLISGTADG